MYLGSVAPGRHGTQSWNGHGGSRQPRVITVRRTATRSTIAVISGSAQAAGRRPLAAGPAARVSLGGRRRGAGRPALGIRPAPDAARPARRSQAG
jgi:hypothetical protein